jgi:hypothetical protein
MTTFLFWNINGKSLQRSIVNLSAAHEVDVVILAESGLTPAAVLTALNEQDTVGYHFPFSQCERVSIYTRFSREFLTPLFETPRLTVRQLTLPGRTEILVAAVHFPSKLYFTDFDQGFECTQLSQEIRRVEEQVGHSRTLLVGDLNMNPFDAGVVSASGLNAAMTRDIALRRTRTVQARSYPFFYNVMWNHFGDNEGAPGTYYYNSAAHVCYFWNMFDQVLVRPDLITAFSPQDLKIIRDDGERTLVDLRGLPDSSISSDHLPMVFKLSL